MATTHYPSWGFETLWRQASRPRSYTLITPHGDLKHGLAHQRGRIQRAHYPSWGFETPICAAPISGTRACRLITPHGDLKQVGPGQLGQDLNLGLITPHGDLKPATGSRRWTCWPKLITPHGDLKPNFFRSRLLGRTHSLPLMGI